jgi:hypothetical protein
LNGKFLVEDCLGIIVGLAMLFFSQYLGLTFGLLLFVLGVLFTGVATLALVRELPGLSWDWLRLFKRNSKQQSQ